MALLKTHESMEGTSTDFSELVDCPACGQRMSSWVVSLHLDTDCPSAPESAAKCVRKGTTSVGTTDSLRESIFKVLFI